MRICYVAKSTIPSRTANSIHVMKMCQAYAELGHRVTLIVPAHAIEDDLLGTDPYAFYGVSRSFVLRKVPLVTRRFGTVRTGLIFPLAAFATRPDFLHTRSVTVAWGCTRLFRCATVCEIHDTPSDNPRERRLFDRLVRSRHLLALVAITQALADRLRREVPATTKLLVAPDGVDGARFEDTLSAEEARRTLGLAAERRRIAVYTGHLYPGRGIETILDLARRCPDYLFLLVGGTNEDVDRYRAHAQWLDNLRLLGFRPPAEVPLYLTAADVLLMPYSMKVAVSTGGDTSAYASPLKMFEYMAAGRPLLASTLPVLQEVLEDGDNALLLPYDQPQLWAQALRRLAEEPDFAAGLGARARVQARRHTWKNRARQLLEATAVRL